MLKGDVLLCLETTWVWSEEPAEVLLLAKGGMSHGGQINYWELLCSDKPYSACLYAGNMYDPSRAWLPFSIYCAALNVVIATTVYSSKYLVVFDLSQAYQHWPIGRQQTAIDERLQVKQESVQDWMSLRQSWMKI